MDSIAMDALGARRATELAVHAALSLDTRSVLVDDRLIVAARELLWSRCRIAVEHVAAATPPPPRSPRCWAIPRGV